jgi:hypothetical protein
VRKSKAPFLNRVGRPEPEAQVANPPSLGLLQQYHPFYFSHRLKDGYNRSVRVLQFSILGGIGQIQSEESLNKRSDSPDNSENSERYQPAVLDQNQTVQALQAQLAEIQCNLAAQHEIIANLTANCQLPQPNSWDSMVDYLMKQFIKSPVSVFNEINVRFSAHPFFRSQSPSPSPPLSFPFSLNAHYKSPDLALKLNVLVWTE